MTIVYDNDALTVTKASRFLTVQGVQGHVFSTRGRSGNIIYNALLREDGSALLTESSDLILF